MEASIILKGSRVEQLDAKCIADGIDSRKLMGNAGSRVAEAIIRDLKIQETVYSLLISQYEQTKIEEARDTTTVQVLDWAAVPEKKCKPAIKKNVLLSGILALFFGIFLSFFLEYIANHRKSSTP